MREDNSGAQNRDVSGEVYRAKRRRKARKAAAATTLKVVIAIIVMVLLIGVVYVGVTYFSPSTKLVNKLEEGNALYDSGDYQGAIAVYQEALAIEPESVEIKNHISHVYVLIANSMGDTDEAINEYQTALAYNIKNTTAYWGVANIFEGRNDEVNMLSALNTGYTNTGDETMKAKLDAIQAEKDRIKAEEEAAAAAAAAEEAERLAREEANNALLAPLAELFAAQDIDGVKELIRTDDYITMSEGIIGSDDVIYYGDKDADGNRNGTGLGAYENGYYYYGDYANNQRSGSGIWIRAVYSESSSIGSYIFDGTWSEDKPNGEGTATSNFYNEKIGATGLVKQVITGKYVNGLEEGNMNMVGTSKQGKTYKYKYMTSAGVAKKINNEDTKVEGQYYIADSGDNVPMLMSDGSPRGVEGLTE